MPHDRRQAVEAQRARSHLDIRMQGHDEVTAAAFARNADVTDHTANPAARHEHTRTFPPHFIQLYKKGIILLNIPELPFNMVVVLKRPVWW